MWKLAPATPARDGRDGRDGRIAARPGRVVEALVPSAYAWAARPPLVARGVCHPPPGAASKVDRDLRARWRRALRARRLRRFGSAVRAVARSVCRGARARSRASPDPSTQLTGAWHKRLHNVLGPGPLHARFAAPRRAALPWTIRASENPPTTQQPNNHQLPTIINRRPRHRSALARAQCRRRRWS